MKKNKYIGICKVGEKGQIVIPKEIRSMFDINAGDSVIVLADKEKGIALVKADVIDNLTDMVLNGGINNGDNNNSPLQISNETLSNALFILKFLQK